MSKWRNSGWGLALAVVWALVGASSQALPAWGAQRHDLLAHGSSRGADRGAPIWVVHVESDGQSIPRTSVLWREVLGDAQWRPLPVIPARGVAMTEHGGELVMLLQNRTWMWILLSRDASRSSFGPLLPGGERIEALAGDHNALFALGRSRADEAGAAATRATTSPTTRPSKLRLYEFKVGAWEERPAVWPEGDEPTEGQQCAMGVVAGVLHMAVYDGQREIKLYRYSSEEGTWVAKEGIRLERYVSSFKVLSLGERLGVWLQPESGVGEIWTATRRVSLAPWEPAPPAGDMDLTVAGDQIRLIFERDKGLFEQRYNLYGSLDGGPIAVGVAAESGEPSTKWLMMTVMTVVAIFVVSTLMRRRAAAQGENHDEEGKP